MGKNKHYIGLTIIRRFNIQILPFLAHVCIDLISFRLRQNHSSRFCTSLSPTDKNWTLQMWARALIVHLPLSL